MSACVRVSGIEHEAYMPAGDRCARVLEPLGGRVRALALEYFYDVAIAQQAIE